MARVRFIGPEPVTVPELGDRHVEPDEVVEVPDERYDGYVCQPAIWEEVEPPPGSAELDSEETGPVIQSAQVLPDAAASKAKAAQAKVSAAKAAPKGVED